MIETKPHKPNKLIMTVFLVGLLTTISIYIFVNRNVSYLNQNIETINEEEEIVEENIFDLVNEVKTEEGIIFTVDGIKNGQTVTGILPIFITPEQGVPIKKIDFYVGKTLIESDSTAPYNSIWDSRKTKDGVNVVYIKITKTDGKTVELAPMTVTVDNPEMDISEGNDPKNTENRVFLY